MTKKILTGILALTFAFAAAGCKGCNEEEATYIPFTVTQTAIDTTVSYEGKTLNATVLNFAEAETPEKVYSVFGNTGEGKTDVSFLGRVQIIDGKVVVGLRVGDTPRMAGIYVKGFGYYFINSADLSAGEYAVCLDNVPVGTFQMSTFSIIEDDFAVGTEVMSFTKDQALLLEGENEGGFTLEYGKLVLQGKGYQSLENLSFAVAKNNILSTGNVTAMVQGDAGVTVGVYGSATGDISRASYIYAGVKDGKAMIIEYSMGAEVGRHEAAIENYSADSAYAISVNVDATQVSLSVNGAIVTLAKAIEGNRNVGFMCLSKNAYVGEVAIPPSSLEQYKEYALAQFDNLVQVEFYEEHITGLNTSYITKVQTSYNDPVKYVFVSRAYDKAKNAINNATDIETAISVYNKYYAELNEEVLTTYKEDIENSLKTMAENVYSIMEYDEEIKNHIDEDNNGDNIPDVTLVYASGAKESFNRGLDGIDGQTWDYRWWIPVPLRTPNILTSAHKELAKCNSKDVLKIMYEEYYDAVLRSVCQKMFEEYHAIKHTENDGYLWWFNWGYWSDGSLAGGSSDFIYNGPVTEYQGTHYGSSAETVYRLSAYLYSPDYAGDTNICLDKTTCFQIGDDGTPPTPPTCKCLIGWLNYAMSTMK